MADFLLMFLVLLALEGFDREIDLDPAELLVCGECACSSRDEDEFERALRLWRESQLDVEEL